MVLHPHTMDLLDVFPNATPPKQSRIDKDRIKVWWSTDSANLGLPQKINRFIAFTRDGAWLKPITGPHFNDQRPMVALAIERDIDCHVLIQTIWQPGHSETYLRFVDGQIVVEGRNPSIVVHFSKSFVGFGQPHDLLLAESLHSLIEDDVQSLASHESEPSLCLSNTEWYKNLAYNTYDSIGLDLDSTKILDAISSLHQSGVYPHVVVLDDGWQQTSNKLLVANEPIREKFPGGLRQIVTDLRQLKVEQVFVWSTIAGFWGGVDPTKFQYPLWKVVVKGKECWIPTSESIYRYYDDFFAYLVKERISGVKIDNLDFLDEISDLIEPADVKDGYHSFADLKNRIQDSYRDAISLASNRHDLQVIWSMAMVPYILQYHGDLNAVGPPVAGAIRNSDDFFPQVNESHFWHIYCNFYNSLYTRQFGHPLHFDMFQSKFVTPDPFLEKVPSLHAAARVLSGGPITITDVPGHHNGNLIKHLTVTDFVGLPRRVLRFNSPPTILDPYASFRESLFFVRAGDPNEPHVLGIFNVTDGDHYTKVDIPPNFVGRSFRSGILNDSENSDDGKIEDDWHILGMSQDLFLRSGDWELINMAELHIWQEINIAVMGYLDKFIGVRAVHPGINFDETVLTLHLVGGGGVLGIYMLSIPDLKIQVDGVDYPYTVDQQLVTLHIPPIASVVTVMKV